MPDQLAPDLDQVAASTDRLLLTCARLSDQDVGSSSLLPGWTVGHVLTHIARNADGLVNLVDWAVSGVESPMYPSMDARNADIEAGAGRSAADIVLDVSTSAARLGSALETLLTGGDDARERLVLFGAPPPGTVPDTAARTLPFARIRELEIHHVDLGLADYGPSDWPPEFVERTLLFIHGRSGPVDIIGDPWDVLAWRLGRGAGPSLRRLDGSPPGEPPAW